MLLLLVFMFILYINIYLYEQNTTLLYICNYYVKAILQGDIWQFLAHLYFETYRYK